MEKEYTMPIKEIEGEQWVRKVDFDFLYEEAYQAGLRRAVEVVPEDMPAIENDNDLWDAHYAGYRECRQKTLTALSEEIKNGKH